jgi:hypothetical protein
MVELSLVLGEDVVRAQMREHMRQSQLGAGVLGRGDGRTHGAGLGAVLRKMR